MVYEDQVQRPLRKAVLALQGADRFASVTKRPDDGHPVVHAGVGQDATRDLRVCGIEFNRVEPGLERHNPGHAQRAVAAVGTQLKQPMGLTPLNRTVQNLPLSSPTLMRK